MTEQLKRLIRDVPDFPKKGIIFRDITPLLADAQGLAKACELMAGPFRDAGIEMVAAVESRGFIFGALLARELAVGFVPIRKPGKLPAETRSRSYQLEYGTDSIEIHADALRAGQRVLMVDDLLATGGTMLAACELVESLGAEVAGISVLIELSFLKGRERLGRYKLHTVLSY